MTGKTVGYIRVSTEEQNPERQLEGFKLDKVFVDKVSGKDTQRFHLNALINYVREGDIVIHLNDQLIGTLFNRAKNRHAEAFHQSGKAINDKVRLYHKTGKALLEAKKLNADPFVAIEGIYEVRVKHFSETKTPFISRPTGTMLTIKLSIKQRKRFFKPPFS